MSLSCHSWPAFRIEFPGALYHITAPSNVQQSILVDDTDRLQLSLGLEQLSPHSRDAGAIFLVSPALLDPWRGSKTGHR